jgi:hypothetical protein
VVPFGDECETRILRARRRRKNAKAVVREVITELARLRQVHEQLDRIADIADQLRFDAFSIASSRVPNRHKASHGKDLPRAGSAC